MSVRPAQIRYLVEGKALGATLHRGWVATWNWVLSFVHHLKGGKGVTVKDKTGGHPVVEALIEAGTGIEVTCGGDGQPYVIGLANDSVDDANGSGADDDVVTSLNDRTGDIDIIGGESIRVDTDGKTIRVSFEEDKAPDEDPNADDGSGYCNDVSHDGSDDDLGDGNGISASGFGPGIGMGGGESDDGGGNEISSNPCKKGKA